MDTVKELLGKDAMLLRNTGSSIVANESGVDTALVTQTASDAAIAAATAATIAIGLKNAVTAMATGAAIIAKTGTVFLTKTGSLGAYTLAAPTSGTDDGKILTIQSTTAFAHTVTQTTPGFNNGSTASDVATFAAVGDSIVVQAYLGVWYVLSMVGVTLG